MIEILKLDRDNPDSDLLDKALHVLQQGDLVIIPTETVYGIACDPSVPGALEKLVKAKGRDGSKPIARLASSPEQVKATAIDWSGGLEALAKTYWPGPLTMVLATKDGWTGYRIPDHAVPLEIAKRCKSPLALTSANLSGEPDTKTAEQAANSVESQLILDSGPSADQAIPSTVIKVDKDSIECIREGAVSFDDIRACFKKGMS